MESLEVDNYFRKLDWRMKENSVNRSEKNIFESEEIQESS